MSTNNLIKQIENISITDESLDSSLTNFYSDNSTKVELQVQQDKQDTNNYINLKKNFFVTKIKLNYYQLWCIFGQIPIVHDKGKCKYEWIIKQENSNRIFSIYDWNNKSNLVNTKQWYIRTNTSDDPSDFLEILSNALECYNRFYKYSVENESFSNDNKAIHKILQELKEEFIKHKYILECI